MPRGSFKCLEIVPGDSAVSIDDSHPDDGDTAAAAAEQQIRCSRATAAGPAARAYKLLLRQESDDKHILLSAKQSWQGVQTGCMHSLCRWESYRIATDFLRGYWFAHPCSSFLGYQGRRGGLLTAPPTLLG